MALSEALKTRVAPLGVLRISTGLGLQVGEDILRGREPADDARRNQLFEGMARVALVVTDSVPWSSLPAKTRMSSHDKGDKRRTMFCHSTQAELLPAPQG
jgi:hypothetical protein